MATAVEADLAGPQTPRYRLDIAEAELGPVCPDHGLPKGGDPVTDTGPKGLLSGRLWPLIVAVVLTALVVFVACFMAWHNLGGGAWRGEVIVMEAVSLAPQRLELRVASCHDELRSSSLSHRRQGHGTVYSIPTPRPLNSTLLAREPTNLWTP